MKNVKLVAPLLAGLLLLTGCHLLPGKAEYFQKHVKALPTAATQPSLVEAQKQAAQFVDNKVSEAKTAAAATAADVSVQVPLAEAATVAGPLSTSLGPPTAPWADTAPKLAVKVDSETAKLDKKVTAYAKKNESVVGKKIEGTGLFQIGFFTQWGILLGVLGLGWVALKIYGFTNPVVGAATDVAQRVSSKVLASGFHQVVAGGNRFLKTAESKLTPENFKQVQEIFKSSHSQEQDSAVQSLVKQLATAS